MDERIDKFSELVDINMEAIRKSLDEKKKEYANLKDKSSIENEERYVQLIQNVLAVCKISIIFDQLLEILTFSQFFWLKTTLVSSLMVCFVRNLKYSFL